MRWWNRHFKGGKTGRYGRMCDLRQVHSYETER